MFVVIDVFTKFVKLYATKTISSSEAITCLAQYFESYSKPKVVISDKGIAFTSREFGDFMREYDVQYIFIATGSPHANGQVERVNRVLIPMLGKLVSDEICKTWNKVLPDIEFALNNSISKTTSETASRLLFGIDQRGKIVDEVKEYLNEICV